MTPLKQHYDAIIIGAGNGGLAAGAVLARGGLSVLVIDKNHIPGGFASSFVRGRFEFDVSLHELCGFGRYDKPFGGVRKLFDSLDLSDKIRWVDIPDAFRLITLDSENPIDVTMPFGLDEFTDKIEEYVPGSGKSAAHIFDLAEKLRNATAELGRSKNTLQKIMTLCRNREFLHFSPLSVNEALAQLDIEPRAADIFRAYWAYICSDCDNLSFLYYLMMVNSYIELKSVVPKARGLEMTLALADCIKENGGEILLNTQVEKILTEGDKAVGVETADGKALYADEIICNTSPHNIFGKLLPRELVTDADIKKMNSREFGGRGFCVYLGLNKSADEIGLKDYSYFIYPDMDTAKQFRLMGKPETNLVQNTVCLNAVNPDASPQGTCMLVMTTLFTSDWWSGADEKDYYRLKNEMAERMISVFERATHTDIKSCIEEIEIASPVTFAHFADVPQGAIYGYLASATDGIIARQLMDYPLCNVKNLYMAGGFSDKLNGYSSSMASGAQTANYILRRRSENEK